MCPRQSVERLRLAATAYDPRGAFHQEAWHQVRHRRHRAEEVVAQWMCTEAQFYQERLSVVTAPPLATAARILRAGTLHDRQLPPLRVPRASPAAVLCEGQLLVIGGMNGDGFLESCEVGSKQKNPITNQQRHHATAVPLFGFHLVPPRPPV